MTFEQNIKLALYGTSYYMHTALTISPPVSTHSVIFAFYLLVGGI